MPIKPLGERERVQHYHVRDIVVIVECINYACDKVKWTCVSWTLQSVCVLVCLCVSSIFIIWLCELLCDTESSNISDRLQGARPHNNHPWNAPGSSVAVPHDPSAVPIGHCGSLHLPESLPTRHTQWPALQGEVSRRYRSTISPTHKL
jgi:hypothetical protein